MATTQPCNNSSEVRVNGYHVNGTSESTSDIAKIRLTIDENNVIDGAKKVLQVIRPYWQCDRIKFKTFTDGITNKLVGCFYKSVSALSDDDNTADYDNDVVLVRVYGNKTDLLIDRKAETRNIKLLHRYGFAPQLYACFDNGLAYEYVPGKTLTVESVRDPTVWPLVARQMARMHRIALAELQVTNNEAMLWPKMQQFLKLVPQKFQDCEKQKRFSQLFPSVDELRVEFEDLYKQLVKLNSPVVFCHNDLLLGNVIFTESEGRVTFIDYEYGAPNYQAFDIGNHFSEFAGVDEIDYSRYPDKAFQQQWLRIYLEEYKAPCPVTDADVERLYVQVNQFSLSAHFLWTIWALIQAEHSLIDFDFLNFGYMHFTEYRTRRDEFLKLKMNE